MSGRYCPCCKEEEVYRNGDEVKCLNCSFTTTIAYWYALVDDKIKHLPIEIEE